MDVCFCWSAWLNTHIISWQENASAPAAYLRGDFVYGVYMCKIKSQAIKEIEEIEQFLAITFPFLSLTVFSSEQLRSGLHGHEGAPVVICTNVKTAGAALSQMCPLWTSSCPLLAAAPVYGLYITTFSSPSFSLSSQRTVTNLRSEKEGK